MGIAAGWIFVATDYIGLGSAGSHPYLIGDGEARSALDSVRAARQMTGLDVGRQTVVWGHSQGGHAALWTGIEATDYAPDVPIAGVAAIAPASDLPALMDVQQYSLVGRIISSFVLRAYSEAYSDVAFDDYAGGWTGLLARDMANRCLAGTKALVSVAEGFAAGRTIFVKPPTTGPLAARLVQNSPFRRLPQPLFVGQGLSDELVLPDIQLRFVHRLCNDGQQLEFHGYAGRDHLSVVAEDSPLTADLLRWTRTVLTGAPLPAGCTGL